MSAGITHAHEGFWVHAAGIGTHSSESEGAPASGRMIPGGVSVHIWPAVHVIAPQMKGAHVPQTHDAPLQVGVPHGQVGIGPTQLPQFGPGGGAGQTYLPPVHRARGPFGQGQGQRSPSDPSVQVPPLDDEVDVPDEPDEDELDVPEEPDEEPDDPDDEPSIVTTEPPHAGTTTAATKPMTRNGEVRTDCAKASPVPDAEVLRFKGSGDRAARKVCRSRHRSGRACRVSSQGDAGIARAQDRPDRVRAGGRRRRAAMRVRGKARQTL